MKTQFITDSKGNKTAAVVPIKEYERLMEELEEFECVKAFDEAQKHKKQFTPAADVFAAIEKKREEFAA